MTKALLMSIGGGVLSALLYLSVVSGGMGALILAYLAPLPLLMVGLGAGLRPFAIAATAAVAAVGSASRRARSAMARHLSTRICQTVPCPTTDPVADTASPIPSDMVLGRHPMCG